jgi:pimeloyl-ACP methyl ester carboxylesterase
MTSHEDAREIFYNDLSDSEAQKWVSKLNRHATKSFEAPCTWAAWKHIPSTYLYCGKDNAVTPAGEEAMINQPGANFRVVRFEEASHSPFLSMPKETADVIRRAAGEKI